MMIFFFSHKLDRLLIICIWMFAFKSKHEGIKMLYLGFVWSLCGDSADCVYQQQQ